jgi:hypothetical protein
VEKGGKLLFCYSQTDFEKNSNIKKKIFQRYTPSKISFFTNYTSWQTSNFYSTDRVDPDAPLEMKIEKTKKKFFVRNGGGGSP